MMKGRFIQTETNEQIEESIKRADEEIRKNEEAIRS